MLYNKAATTEKLCTYNGNDIEDRGAPTPRYQKLYETVCIPFHALSFL